MNNIISLNKISKSFTTSKKITNLNKINYQFKKGKIYSLVGPSGSGKSTLLNILSMIDKPTYGSLLISNKKIDFSETINNDKIRSKKIGIILGVMFSLYIENLREFLSDTFNITLFPEEIYFLSKMPSEINPTSIFIISLCSVSITILVSIFPAIKASKLDPVKGLKYE